MCTTLQPGNVSVGKTPVGAPGVRSSPLVQSNALFTKYPSSRQSQSYNSSNISQRVLPKKKLRYYCWCHLTPLTVCARCSCSGRVAGFGRCRVSTVLRPDGTDWGWEDMLAKPLPLQAGGGCGTRADALHYRLFLLASNLLREKKKKHEPWDKVVGSGISLDTFIPAKSIMWHA